MSEVKLVAITQPLIDGVNTAEEFVAYAARVSNPGNQINNETAAKLLKYLAKHSHWSPFEMVSMTFEIKTTRDIGRQILRHRSFSFQEFSQRYAAASTQFESREARLQDHKNRQNSIKTDDTELAEWWQNQQLDIADQVSRAYTEALEKGIAKEQARAILPEGLTKSTMYMSGTLRSWIHYCDLRSAHGTQLEHQEIAIAIWEEIVKRFPSLSVILEKE
jgi:thymidylate synthase (FAD)